MQPRQDAFCRRGAHRASAWWRCLSVFAEQTRLRRVRADVGIGPYAIPMPFSILTVGAACMAARLAALPECPQQTLRVRMSATGPRDTEQARSACSP